ncbi:polysaccharide pyruvyl transferase family protein [Microbacterium arborescens]|uniref:polysaccharide pyruvyl transferase family protein n=1 Tax=Microbacterium arborescens TaxID=33883 RepID=UPI0023E36311|nr:polysaccharide pyruvyl transferase family protein [Microbacterium arborescens]
MNNFGDLLGPRIVTEILRRRCGGRIPRASQRGQRLLSVGSVLRLSRAGDVVWGTGMNGKSLGQPLSTTDLDVRAVRGPRTASFLESVGVNAPHVYGDPGLLVGTLWPRESFAAARAKSEVVVIPNLNDLPHMDARDPRLVLPTSPLKQVLSRITSADLVVGSSLHAIVIAEAFGVPARAVRSDEEPEFKYQDYFEGSGRTGVEISHSVEDAIAMGGAQPLDWDPAPLLRAFPWDLWAAPAHE